MITAIAIENFIIYNKITNFLNLKGCFMKEKLLSAHKFFWKAVITSIMMIFILSLFDGVEIYATKEETLVPTKININLTDVFQLDMFSITEKDSNGKTKVKFASVSDDLSSLKTGTMSGIVCIGTYDDKKVITVISPLRGGEFKTKRPLNGIGTICEITSSDMVNAVKEELDRKKMLDEISSDLDTNHYIVIDDEAIMKETEKLVNKDLEKIKNAPSPISRKGPIFGAIGAIIIIVRFIVRRRNK